MIVKSTVTKDIKDLTPPPDPSDAAGSDADWAVESHSASVEPPPLDTTAGKATPEPAAAVEAAEGVADAQAGAGDDDGAVDAGVTTRGAGEESASAAGRPPRDDAGRFAKGKTTTTPKPRSSPTARTSQLQGDIDRLTHLKHKTAGEIAQLEAKRAALLKETGGTTAPGAPVAAAPATGQKADIAAPKPMPEPPNYRDFATDEEYETARNKWHADVATWHTGETERLKADITSGVEARFKSSEQAAASAASEAEFTGRIEAERAKHADWDQQIAGLKDLRSSWYDPAFHGVDTTTPMLSALVRFHPEGPGLLPWLGSDPERAQLIADLMPTPAIGNALMHVPSLQTVLDHFTTPEGVQEYEALRAMHPQQVAVAMGALSARLGAGAAPRGSAPAPRPITSAVPPAKPPVGAPGARGAAPAKSEDSFESFMAAEDAKDQEKRRQLAGLPATA